MSTMVSDKLRKSSQAKTFLHWGAVLAFGAIVLLAYQNPVFLGIGFVGFLLVTSLHMVWKMIIFVALMSIVLLVLPFLAPVAIIVMIILFIMRIGFVITHWRPILLGLLFYGSGVPLLIVTEAYYYNTFASSEPFIVATVGVVLLHFGLVWLYANNYSTKTALGIMGSVPIVIIAFILPFLKLHLPAPDVFMEVKPVTGGQPFVSEPILFQSEAKPISGGHAIATEPISIQPPEVKPLAQYEKPVIHTPQVNQGVFMEATQSTASGYNPNTIPAGQAFVIEPATTSSNNPSNMMQGTIKLQSNIFGGEDYYQDGIKKMSSHANVFDGQDYYGSDNQKIASSQSNIFNGENIVDKNNQLIYRTQENIFGGHDIYDKNNSRIGYTFNNAAEGLVLADHYGNRIGVVQNGFLRLNG